MTLGLDHPYQEFNSKRALFHHLRVDHGWGVDQGWEGAGDLPSHYYEYGSRSRQIAYGPLLADHEEFHTTMAKYRGTS